MGSVRITRKKTTSSVLELRVLILVDTYKGSDYHTAISLADRLNTELDQIKTGNEKVTRHSYKFVADEEKQTVDLWKLNSYGDSTRHVLQIDFV